MASQGGRASYPLSAALDHEPHRFEFFQAVRILQALAPTSPAVGRDGPPRAEPVRFCAESGLAFPASQILDLDTSEAGTVPKMVVRFLGLTGPMGALPIHYTELVVERLRRRDRTLADFLDLFNHRLASLFYRAWDKYHPHLRARATGDDELAGRLACLIGLGTPGLRERLSLPIPRLLAYAGLLAQHPRSAIGLEHLLTGYFGGIDVRIEQFVGQWLALDPESQTRLGDPFGNGVLGLNTVVGSRVWSTQSRFRVRLGPMSYERLCSFLPDGEASAALVALTRFYAGRDYDFDFRLVLARTSIRTTQLGSTGPTATRLGWSSWVVSREAMEDSDAVVIDATTYERHASAA